MGTEHIGIFWVPTASPCGAPGPTGPASRSPGGAKLGDYVYSWKCHYSLGKTQLCEPRAILGNPPWSLLGFLGMWISHFSEMHFQVCAFRGPLEGPEGAQTSKSYKNGPLRDPRSVKIGSGTP